MHAFHNQRSFWYIHAEQQGYDPNKEILVKNWSAIRYRPKRNVALVRIPMKVIARLRGVASDECSQAKWVPRPFN